MKIPNSTKDTDDDNEKEKVALELPQRSEREMMKDTHIAQCTPGVPQPKGGSGRTGRTPGVHGKLLGMEGQAAEPADSDDFESNDKGEVHAERHDGGSKHSWLPTRTYHRS